MCCLFGIIDCHGRFTAREKARILSVLATECEERGTDATGIAYCTHDHLSIYKRPLEAHRLRFRIPEDSRVIMGHTRMTTQGTASRNCNNHPFLGNAAGRQFALAHNGVLWNDHILRYAHGLPETKIETDSYIAVQLIEQKNALDFASLRDMAEQLEGTFTFSVMDEQENLYFVKGNNPLCLYHYPRYGVYLYASTEAILTRALRRLPMFRDRPERIEMDCGDLLKISATGQRTWDSFDSAHLYQRWAYWPPAQSTCFAEETPVDQDYLHELKSVAYCFGFSPEAVDRLLASGFSADEIAEFLYDGAMC